EMLPGRPLQFPLQRFVNGLILVSVLLLAVVVVSSASGIFTAASGHSSLPTLWTGSVALWGLFAAALLLGAMFVLPIGGGDMPVVISILNSLTGLAAALTGFVLHNQMLVVAGGLVGASGETLTLVIGRELHSAGVEVVLGGFWGE